jgi:hydroxypyruvate isomerase
MTRTDTAPPYLRFDANLGWLFTESPFEQRFEAAARAGFTGVEYSRSYDLSPGRLQKCLRDAGLRQVLINSPAGEKGSRTEYGTACHPGGVEQFRRGFLIALEYADALECELIHIPGGIRPADASRDLAFATYVSNIAWAVEKAADTKVTIALEAINHRDAPDFVLDSVEQAAAVVRALDSSRLGIMFDIYHCQINGGDLSARLRELLPMIVHMQIADVPGRGEPGTGEIGWDHVFGQVRALGYTGWLGCEYRPTNGTVDSLRWRGAHMPDSASVRPSSS